MANSQLTLYDFVVDVIPGLVVGGLLIVLLPDHPFVSRVQAFGGLASGFFAIAGGYAIGRLLHGVSGFAPVEDVALIVGGELPGTPTDRRRLRFEDRIRHVREQSDPKTLEYQVVDGLVGGLKDRFPLLDARLSSPLPGEPGPSEPGQSHDLEYARYLADSVLYGQGNLSWKYALLVTFFRNLWVAFAVFGVAFFLRPLLSSFPLFASVGLTTRVPVADLALGIALLAGALVCINLRFTFEERRSRASINELYFELADG